MIGLITLDEKCAGARSAGNPHAACEAEGTGNGAMASRTEARRPKGTARATGSLSPPRQSSTLPGSPRVPGEPRRVTGWRTGRPDGISN